MKTPSPRPGSGIKLEQIKRSLSNRLGADNAKTHAWTIRGLMARLRQVLDMDETYDPDSFAQIFETCERIDWELAQIGPSLHGDVFDAIRRTRVEVGTLAVNGLYEKLRHSADNRNAESAARIQKQYEIARILLAIIPDIRAGLKRDSMDSFDQRWFAKNCKDRYPEVVRYLADEDTGVMDWEVFREVLPPDLRERFKPSAGSLRKETAQILQDFGPLLELVGVGAVLQYLVSIGRISGSDRDTLRRNLSESVGPHRVLSQMTPKDFLDQEIPPAFLKMTEGYRLLFLFLRNSIYQKLVSESDDKDTEFYRKRFGVFDREMTATLKGLEAKYAKWGDGDVAIYGRLFDDIREYYGRVFDLSIPDRIHPVLRVGSGRNTVISHWTLRQRIAMIEMADSHRKLVAFFMGGGKTATAFLCKEHVEAKRMLYICPPNIVAQTEEKIRLYYQGEKRPTVGIVRASMSDEELADALRSEIVLLPFSMLGAVRRDSRDGEEKDIARIIGDIPFDMLCVDEAHNAKKEGNLYTDTIFRLARTIPGLYESGYVLELTGDPIPNTPDDIVARLRMLDPEHYPEARGLRQIIRDTSSAVVKNSLMDLLLLIDVPEDWERHVVSDPFELSDPERRAYDLIVANEDLLFTDKYHALNLFLLNPGRFSSELAYGPSTLVYRAIGKIEGFLKQYDAVVVTENNYKYGVTRNRPGQTEESEPSVCDRLRAHFGDTAEVCVIDGDTPDHERDAIIARSKEGKKKMIIVAVGKVIREGLDSLSHIHRAIVLEPDICKSNLSQLVKRFARNGNEDVEVHVLQASGTIHAAMDAHANQKHELTRRILLFDTPDASELDRLGDPDSSGDTGFVPGSALGEMLYVDRAKILKMLSMLHNAGEEVANDWYDQYGEFMTELLSKRWKYSYEANNSRFVTSLIARLEEEGLVPGKSYADIGCGNATLARMLPERPDAKEVHGVDINPYTIDQARRTWDRSSPLRISEGRMSDLRSVFEDGKFGLVNCALALQETKLNVRRTRRPENDERVRSILEMRRILMPGGILVLTLPRFSCTQEEMRKLASVLETNLGFEVLPEYSGQARGRADGVSFENHTLVCRKAGETNLKDLDLRNLQCSQRTSSTVSSREEDRAKNERTVERVPDGHIFTEFTLADHRFSYKSTESDAQAVAQAEYKASVELARSWLQEELVRRQTLADISRDELTTRSIATLVRIELRRKGYWIFQLEGYTDRTGEYVVSPGE